MKWSTYWVIIFSSGGGKVWGNTSRTQLDKCFMKQHPCFYESGFYKIFHEFSKSNTKIQSLISFLLHWLSQKRTLSVFRAAPWQWKWKKKTLWIWVTFTIYTGCLISIWTIFESGCGIQMSQATPTKFSMLFKHTYKVTI